MKKGVSLRWGNWETQGQGQPAGCTRPTALFPSAKKMNGLHTLKSWEISHVTPDFQLLLKKLEELAT